MPPALPALLLVGAIAIGAACSGDGDQTPTATFTECGLPSPQPGFDAGVVPSGFLPSGAEITNAEEERGGFVAAINLRASVNDAFESYKEALADEGFRLTGEDNEGFEAELYFRKGKRKLGAIQIRSSRCEQAVVVFVQVVDRKFLG